MKSSTVAAGFLAILTLGSCTENESPKTQAPLPRENALVRSLREGTVTYSPNMTNTQAVARPRDPNLGVSPTASALGTGTTAAAQAPVEPAVEIPKDARWTLYCSSISGPDRFARAAQLKAYFTANTPFKDWYVVHNEQDSTLFYGFYPSVEKSERASARAQKDRSALIAWKNEAGERPFVACFFTPITPPTPLAPAEWNLVNAPPRAYWSVQVAAFLDNPQRKQAAVEAVKELRAKGVDAYFYHGQSISSVCVGAWPANAVKEQDEDSGRAVDPDAAVMVSSGPLPAKYKNAKMSTRDGQKLVAYAERIEIDDPSLKATLREYPEHMVNYEAVAQKVKQPDGSTKLVPTSSFLVRIPREEANGMNEGVGIRGLLAPANPAAADPTRQPEGTGRLRGLGH